MLGGSVKKGKITQIYLQNGKNLEKTIDLFLSGAVEEQKEETKLTIIDTSAKEKEILQQAQNRKQDLLKAEQAKAYLLDEYKEVLFPKAKNKYELMQHKVIEQQKSDEAKEQVEIRKKILALAEMM